MAHMIEPNNIAPKIKRKQRARKTSCAPNRGENVVNKLPGLGQRLKELWKDPEWRARTLANQRAAGVKRRGPGKGRIGVPDGMRKAEALQAWAVAKESADKTMIDLEKAGLLDESPAEAKEALQAALEVMRSPMDHKTKLAAARLVLDFTKSKPASKSVVAVDEAEVWLAQIAGKKDNDDKQGETSQNA